MRRSDLRWLVGWMVWGVIAAATPGQSFGQADDAPAPKKPFRYQTGLAFSSDGALIATCGDRVRVFEVATGKKVSECDEAKTHSIAFSPAVKDLFATGGEDGVIRLWKVGAEQAVRELRGHDGWVLSLAFDREGKFLASSSDRYRNHTLDLGQFRLWDVETGKQEHSLNVSEAGIKGVSFSNNGDFVAFCRNVKSDGASADVYRVRGWQSVASFKLPVGKLQENPYGVVASIGMVTRFAPGDQTLYVAGGTCVPASPEQVRPYKGGCTPTGLVWSCDLQGDPNDAASVKLLIDPRPGYYGSFSLSPDGKRFATDNGFVVAANRQEIEMRDLDRWRRLWSVPGRSSHLHGVTFSPNGKLVAACGGIDVQLVDAETGTVVRVITVGE